MITIIRHHLATHLLTCCCRVDHSQQTQTQAQTLLPLLTAIRSTSPVVDPCREMNPELQHLHSDKCLCTNNKPDLGGRRLGRRLVVAFDATTNQFGPEVRKVSTITSRSIRSLALRGQSSHVVEFYSRIVKSGDQLSYYTSGIGTFVEPSSSMRHMRMWIKSKWAAAMAL